MKRNTLCWIAAMIAGLATGHARLQAEPLGTAFAFQGRLTDGGAPAMSRPLQWECFQRRG